MSEGRVFKFSNLKCIRDGETTIKIKFSLLRGWGRALGVKRRIVQKRCFFFVGSTTTIKILKVDILLLRDFLVMAQAPNVMASEKRMVLLPALSRCSWRWRSRPCCRQAKAKGKGIPDSCSRKSTEEVDFRPREAGLAATNWPWRCPRLSQGLGYRWGFYSVTRTQRTLPY